MAPGTFRYAISEPSAIVPPAAADPHGLAVVDAVFDSLTAYDRSLGVVPAAAVSWTSDGPSVWTFRLRSNGAFHDGRPVTAADFKFSWEQAVRLDLTGYHLADVAGYEALRTGATADLAGVSAPDEQTLTVVLSSPRADFPAVVAHPALGPLHRERWIADEAAFREQPVGNGPFAMASPWAHGGFIRVVRYDGWRNGGPVKIDEVVFRIMDPDSAYVAFQQRRQDFASVPAGALADARADFPPQPPSQGGAVSQGSGLLLGPSPVLYFLGYNVARPPFDDVGVRRAVSLAIDRAALVAATLEGNVAAAGAVVPPPIPGARPLACTACAHDPAQARQLFAERAVTTIELWFNRDGGHEQIAELIRADLAAVGVQVVFRSEPPPPDGAFGAYLDVLASGEAGLFRFGWTTEYPTMDAALRPLFHSSSTPATGGQNYMGYAAPQVDQLLDEARSTLDDSVRMAIYRQAEDVILNQDQVIAPLFTYRHRAVAAERVEGLYLSPWGLVNLPEISLRS